MASLYTALGLTQPALSERIPNYGPSIVIANFFVSYVVITPRWFKHYYGIDHNEAPREDLNKYGDLAVREGKLTQRQLEMIRRCEAAQANSVENFPLLAVAVAMASYAEVPRQTINAAGLIYTAARVSYGILYVLIDQRKKSLLRTVAWWVGNISALHLLWKAGQLLS